PPSCLHRGQAVHLRRSFTYPSQRTAWATSSGAPGRGNVTLRDQDACIHRVSRRVPHLRNRRPLLRRLALAVEIRCNESEDATRAHLAGEDVGSENRTKPSPILAQRSSETVIVQFWRTEKIVVWVHHQLHGTTMLQT